MVFESFQAFHEVSKINACLEGVNLYCKLENNLITSNINLNSLQIYIFKI